MQIDLKQLRELMRAMRQFGMNDLEVEQRGERIRLARGTEGSAPASANVVMPTFIPQMTTPMPPEGERISEKPPADAPAEDPSIVYITSPFVGTFYRASSPSATPFVEIGQHITPGQTLCIVEAMKLMNQIESEIAGQVLEVYVENGMAVEYGARLFKVKKA